ncbi:MAG: response regulator [Proteobacteria bacterium]|nr:response regulator [Pseudomonadota bacterium]
MILQPSGRLNLRKTRILLVDDNPHSLDLVLQVLLGFRVPQPRCCASAEESRGLLEFESFDLILADCEMPNEDGLSLTRYVRSRRDQLNFTAPIVLMSGSTSFQRISAARDAGANMVVRKPISPGVLMDRILWLARVSRPFITSDAYCGPDRRFKSHILPPGVEERRAEALALTASPERALSQTEVDSLFG